MLVFSFHEIMKLVTKPGVPDKLEKKKKWFSLQGSPWRDFGELSSCAVGDMSMAWTLSLFSVLSFQLSTNALQSGKERN